MSGKIVINPINHGVRTDRTAFNIDNDSFPKLLNAYQWRGRLKRKRGTSTLTRLSRLLPTASIGNSLASPWTINTIYSTYTPAVTPETHASIKPGSVRITIGSGPGIVFIDQGNGTLTSTTGGNSGTINYLSGVIVLTHTAGATVATTATFSYYPNLPVLGLENLNLDPISNPGMIGFDTTYAYNMLNTFPYNNYNVNYYKNPAASPPYDYPDYVAKTVQTSFVWNSDPTAYQQFWTTNYQDALWATNGITVPFVTANVGMQFKPIVSVTVVDGGPPAKATLQITGHALVVGDFLFVNEVQTTTGINFQIGYVITVTDTNNVIVEFPNATIATDGTGGIAQYLTNNSDPTKDVMRWYDGDPTSPSSRGWVNFSPPLSQDNFAIADAPSGIYYLVTARMVIPFKDRLLFIGPVVQTASGTPLYLPDTVIYSQNGTPYYTASFTGDVDLPTTLFTPILTPLSSTGTKSTVQTATPSSYFTDQTGFGGFISSGLQQAIITVSQNEDVLVMGMSDKQIRFVYTGNDILPFNFYTINSELGSFSTFSSVNLDRGVISVGSHGFVITSQVSAQRIDLEIPDQVFEFNLNNNGTERVCAQRDFINEWIYFTYLSNQSPYMFPNQTLQYNYRDASWAIFNENYTTYGTFRKKTGYTWATIGTVFPTWAQWNEPWNSGSSTLLQPQVVAGNQQGFVMVRDDSTTEGASLFIESVVGNLITSTNHCLNNNDFIVISGALGLTGINNIIFKVGSVSTNTFTISNENNDQIITGTYIGGGVITRMYRPKILSKQFPIAWDLGRKTRIGVQKYLLSTTPSGQITLEIYLSQGDDQPYNFGPVIPDPNSENGSLIYTQVLYTCPESTNIGLSPMNSNLQMPTAPQQQQIWHRMNTSLIGDTIQVGFTLSDEQMFNSDLDNQFTEIELHSMIISVSPSSLLA